MVTISRKRLIFQAIHLVLRAFGRFGKWEKPQPPGWVNESVEAQLGCDWQEHFGENKQPHRDKWEQLCRGACDDWAPSRGWAGCAVRARRFPLLFSCTVMPLPFNAAYPCWDAFRFSRVYLALVLIRLTMFSASSAKFMCLHVRSIVSHRSVDVTTVRSTCTGCFSTDGIL